MHSKKIDIGNYVEFYRKLNGLTQAELGAMIGTTYKAISGLENFQRNPTFESCVRLSRVFGIDVNDLFFEKGKAPEKRMTFIEKGDL